MPGHLRQTISLSEYSAAFYFFIHLKKRFCGILNLNKGQQGLYRIKTEDVITHSRHLNIDIFSMHAENTPSGKASIVIIISSFV